MKKLTMELPCHPVVDGVYTMLAFTGVVVGPFLIHRMNPDSTCLHIEHWTISHIATGYSVMTFIRLKTQAIFFAKQLADLKCWDFSKPEDARKIHPETLRKIGAIKACA